MTEYKSLSVNNETFDELKDENGKSLVLDSGFYIETVEDTTTTKIFFDDDLNKIGEKVVSGESEGTIVSQNKNLNLVKLSTIDTFQKDTTISGKSSGRVARIFSCVFVIVNSLLRSKVSPPTA